MIHLHSRLNKIDYCHHHRLEELFYNTLTLVQPETISYISLPMTTTTTADNSFPWSVPDFLSACMVHEGRVLTSASIEMNRTGHHHQDRLLSAAREGFLLLGISRDGAQWRPASVALGWIRGGATGVGAPGRVRGLGVNEPNERQDHVQTSSRPKRQPRPPARLAGPEWAR